MQVDYSSLKLISWQAIQNSKMPFSWNKCFSHCFVSLVYYLFSFITFGDVFSLFQDNKTSLKPVTGLSQANTIYQSQTITVLAYLAIVTWRCQKIWRTNCYWQNVLLVAVDLIRNFQKLHEASAHKVMRYYVLFRVLTQPKTANHFGQTLEGETQIVFNSHCLVKKNNRTVSFLTATRSFCCDKQNFHGLWALALILIGPKRGTKLFYQSKMVWIQIQIKR